MASEMLAMNVEMNSSRGRIPVASLPNASSVGRTVVAVALHHVAVIVLATRTRLRLHDPKFNVNVPDMKLGRVRRSATNTRLRRSDWRTLAPYVTGSGVVRDTDAMPVGLDAEFDDDDSGHRCYVAFQRHVQADAQSSDRLAPTRDLRGGGGGA